MKFKSLFSAFGAVGLLLVAASVVGFGIACVRLSLRDPFSQDQSAHE
jgi:hypothetical protein